MTIKEIARLCNVSESTVRNWITSAKIAKPSAETAKATNTPFDFTLPDTLSIIRAGGNQTLADLLAENATSSKTVQSGESHLTPKDLELISTLTAGIVSKIFANFDGRMTKIETKIEQRAALLPPPEMKPRDHINKLVREYARNHNIDFPSAWRELYSQFGYRTNTNPSVCASNRGMSIIDYIDSEGMIGTLESVAVDIYGKALPAMSQ